MLINKLSYKIVATRLNGKNFQFLVARNKIVRTSDNPQGAFDPLKLFKQFVFSEEKIFKINECMT